MARLPSATAHAKVLDAAVELIAERGIEGTSMDAIAQRSGVSKATVYNHWEDKEALCIDVIGSFRQEPPDFSSGDTRQNLIDFVTHHSRVGPDSLIRIWPRIMGYAAANPKFGLALQQHSFGPRRAQITGILAEGAKRGDLPSDIDPDLAMDLLIGPVVHRRFAGTPMSGDFPAQVVDNFLRGQSVTP